jgi:hypothetical protein
MLALNGDTMVMRPAKPVILQGVCILMIYYQIHPLGSIVIKQMKVTIAENSFRKISYVEFL